MIRLAVFDIDRTLVSASTGTIAPETVAALEALRSGGIRTAIATGRQWQQLPKMLKSLNFDYYILLNGTNIADRSGRLLWHTGLSLADARSLADIFLEKDRSLYLRFVSGMYPVLLRDRQTPFGMARETVPKELLEGLLTESPLDCGECPMAALGQIPAEEEDWFRQRYPAMDFLPVFGGKNCDINPKGISKATGLVQVCRLLDIPVSETIAFGDDVNDLDIIRTAGIGVAMGDALEEVKAAADYVTNTCEELGVVRGLKHFRLIE